MAYYDAVRRILIIIFILNILTALAKGIYGLYTDTLSMSADGLHSLFDSTANIIGLVGISLAARPPDRDHPYGHAKYESFAAIGIAILLFASCLQLMLAAVDRLQSRAVPDVTQISFAIMASTLIINIGVSSYEYILGRRLKSSILVADSMHTRSDIYASLGVILGLFAVRMGYPLADPLIALFICLLIVHTGLEILKESSTALLDRAAVDEQVIVDLARSVEGVCNCHAVRTRGMAEEIYVDLHIGVDASLSMDKAHEVGEDVERAIKSRIPEVRDVVVHLEPRDYCENKSIQV
ncbi:MAG: cation diffusion facilitator family transporter [Methanosaeta sp. ASP1-1]|jgi:cation diffusion facilitator family transporter|nr:cation diffusion facilitator family transporter [Methanothrix sp.]OYV08719.1 MAG: cation diffusion facilitator family transporter [Methanosaeta sp. ASP1-1]OYV13285.1 MAG: cation diffusion facilitator family transporter [Methanosaeta sp. ASO1]OYV14643.1 MAG: cation diffusion facilitator family transporter [Methanosaeta sp. NSM2]MDD1730832.1 cation diffusion facilitator family transporter [Methanothrix sp.]